jgi:hypothetical protein
VTLRIRLHLRECVLYLSAAVLVTGPAVLMAVLLAVPFRAMSPAVLMRRPFRASARVDVGKVERVGLGEVAQIELDEDPVGGVLEGGGATHPGVVLGVQSELYVSALVMSSVVLMPAFLALGAATGAPDQQEGSRECHNTRQEYLYAPHAWEDTIGAGAIPSELSRISLPRSYLL